MFPRRGICYAVGRALCLCHVTYSVVVQTRSRYPRKAEATQRKKDYTKYSKNYTDTSGLSAFLCSGHPRKPRQIFKCLFEEFTRHGRTLGIPITPEFLGEAVGLHGAISRHF